jgi:hypothetical protein
MDKYSRRKFLTIGSLVTLGTASHAMTIEDIKRNITLMHHVFFWLKNPESAEDLEKLIEGVQTLSKIKSLRMFQISLPANTPARPVIDSTYSISLFTSFDDVAGHNLYQDDPVHLKFVDTYSNLWNKVVVYDSMAL